MDSENSDNHGLDTEYENGNEMPEDEGLQKLRIF